MEKYSAQNKIETKILNAYTTYNKFNKGSILLYLLFLIASCTLEEERNTEKKEPVILQDLTQLKDQLLNADSVWIVSHAVNLQFGNDTSTKKYKNPSDVFADSGLHCSIIKERKLVKDSALAELATIITRPAKNTDTVFSACCVPAHTILIIKKGEISYLDFCLDCHGLISSPSIHLSTDNFDSTKWSQLRDFVKRMGIRYEI